MRWVMAIGAVGGIARAAPQSLPPPNSPAALTQIMSDVRASDWADATMLASMQRDRLVAKLVTYYRLLDPGVARAAEIAAFQARNPDWPQQTLLNRRWSEAVQADPNDATVRAACRQRAAMTSKITQRANARCASALAGDPAQAKIFARRAWIDGFSEPRDAARFQAQFGPLLGPQANWARFQRLAGAGDDQAALTLLPGLTAAQRAVGGAWLALVRQRQDATTRLAALSVAQQETPFLFLARARLAATMAERVALWEHQGAAAARRAEQPGSGSYRLRGLFWSRADGLVRDLLEQNDATDAYRIAAAIPPASTVQRASRDFLAGFVALRFLHQPQQAAPWFLRLAHRDKAVITQARGWYWLAQTASGPAQQADLARAAAFPDSFYGQLAALQAGDTAAQLAARIRAAARIKRNAVVDVEFAERELPQAAFVLSQMGAPRRASAFLLRAGEASATPADWDLAAQLAQRLGQTPIAVAIARQAGVHGVMLIRQGWPIPPSFSGATSLTLAISREESSFDPNAVSGAGAIGLMQLLPGTAAQIARRDGLAAGGAGLRDPGQNIALGTAYLALLRHRFGDCTPLAIAAYNAGPGNVAAWLSRFGDPRLPVAAGGVDLVAWLEEIPFGETRNYVQRVTEAMVVYRALQGKPARDPVQRWVHP
jgi:soluble lytic murein transglycosylase